MVVSTKLKRSNEFPNGLKFKNSKTIKKKANNLPLKKGDFRHSRLRRF